MECWKRCRGDVTLAPTNVGLSYTFVPLTSPRVSVCVCMSVRIYCIQTTGSFSVAPPSVQGDLIVFEFEVGWLVNSVCCTWNIFDFVCCVQPESAVSNMCWALMGAHTHYTCTKRMNQPSNTYVLCVLCTYSYEGMVIKGFCFGLYKCQLLISVIKAALCRLCP